MLWLRRRGEGRWLSGRGKRRALLMLRGDPRRMPLMTLPLQQELPRVCPDRLLLPRHHLRRRAPLSIILHLAPQPFQLFPSPFHAVQSLPHVPFNLQVVIQLKEAREMGSGGEG